MARFSHPCAPPPPTVGPTPHPTVRGKTATKAGGGGQGTCRRCSCRRCASSARRSLSTCKPGEESFNPFEGLPPPLLLALPLTLPYPFEMLDL